MVEGYDPMGWVDPEGNPLDDISAASAMEEKGRLIQAGQADGRLIIGQTQTASHWVSTVWLGLNHGYYGELLIFETKVFCHHGQPKKRFWHRRDRYCPLYDYTVRYPTKEAAGAGHDQTLAMVLDFEA